MSRSSLHQIEASESRGWQLHFTNKLPHIIFTGNKIETEDGDPLQIIVLDSTTKKMVTTGPVSSLKLEIYILDADFGSDSREDWSEENFTACVLRERDGKRPLVTGELHVTIKDGIGYLFCDREAVDIKNGILGASGRLTVELVQSCVMLQTQN